MANGLDLETDPHQPMIYQIRIESHLGREWTDWFGGLTITLEEDGDTLLTGLVEDQAALYGLLKRVRNLGMPLISAVRVNQVRKMRPTPYNRLMKATYQHRPKKEMNDE